MEKALLESGKFYHIYNRGNNSQDIFFEKENYIYFLKKYQQYISPICNTLAFALMRNHFHFLVYIKNDDEINSDELTYETVEQPKRIDAHLQFGHFFNAYAKAINKKYKRTGSLFEKRFNRKEINNSQYLLTLIHYIHTNPVRHGIVNHPNDYFWSSYKSIYSNKISNISREIVQDLFDSEEHYINFHLSDIKYDDIKSII